MQHLTKGDLNMRKRTGFSLLLAAAVLVLSTQGALAQDEWHFGIGTGFGTLALDGDIGFRGFKGDIDLDNSETSDLVESAFGLAGFASKGNWAILWSAGSLTLEDDDKGLEAEWDRVAVELAGVYSFVNSERNRLGYLVIVVEAHEDGVSVSASSSSPRLVVNDLMNA